ncbi:protein mono-ADP-ribosyltransferase TIPARP-like [Emydura macquarii macquarii]|uniref:protein mono-ADP-ribosyltransferase TIPARP-like n=1 Tax=Emydura macquarii macquarii TaxID=1129001 RepID=UPI00352A835B
MGQRISRGVLGQLGGSPQRKPSPADSDHGPVTEGTSATHSQPQQETERQKRRWSGFPSGCPGERVHPGPGKTPQAGQAEGQDSPPPVPAKRWHSSPPAAERWVSQEGVPFHVHQEEGIRICDSFLLGQCRRRESCPLHHTRYPFHWQVAWSRRAAWQSLNDSSQRHLEKLYSDAHNGRVQVSGRSRAMGLLDLHTMELSYSGGVSRARRLGTTSDWKQSPRFHTRWKVYWRDGHTWKPCEEPVPRGLLAAFERGSGEPTWEFQGQLYTMDLRAPQQSTEDLGSLRPTPIQRRPAYRSLSRMARYLWTVPRGPMGLFHPVPGERPTDGYRGPYPATWVPQPPQGQAFLPAEVASSEAVYRQICELFHASVPEETALVLRIYRIRNDALWERYRSQKERMSRGRSAQENRLLERHLFHGTAAENVAPICRVNFNPRLSGKHGAHYGRGCYFSSHADGSHGFALAGRAGQRHMFLAKVLVGRSALGRHEYAWPPEMEPGGRRYDSCSNGAQEPNVYVIFDSSQCYPYFVICYKLLGDPVMLDGVGGAAPLAQNP